MSSSASFIVLLTAVLVTSSPGVGQVDESGVKPDTTACDAIAAELGITFGPSGITYAEEKHRRFEEEVMKPFLASREWGDERVIEHETKRETRNGNRVTSTSKSIHDISSWHDPAWDDDAEAFLREWGKRVSGMPGAMSNKELMLIGHDIYSRGCREPMVNYAYGWAQDQLGKKEIARMIFQKANSWMNFADYPTIRRFHVRRRYGFTCASPGFRERGDQAMASAGELLLEVIDSEPYDTIELKRDLTVDIFDMVSDDVSLDVAKAFIGKLREKKSIDPCTLHTGLAKWEIRLAWESRGRGFARSVTEEGWAGFHNHMEAACEHLKIAHRTDPTRPEAAGLMLKLVMADHAPPYTDLTYWLNKTMEAQIDYRPAFQHALWAMSPRWGGSHANVLDLGLFCLALERYDTELPLVFLAAVQQIFSDQVNPGREIIDAPEMYEVLCEVIEKTAAHPNHAHRADWLRSVQVAIAFSSGRLEDAQRGAVALGDQRSPHGLNYFGMRFEDAKRLIREAQITQAE